MGLTKLSDALLTLMLLAERSGVNISLSLEHDSGRYIPGELNYDGSERQNETNVIQGPAGWEITVGQWSETGQDGKQMLYPDLESAVNAGFALLKQVMKT